MGELMDNDQLLPHVRDDNGMCFICRECADPDCPYCTPAGPCDQDPAYRARHLPSRYLPESTP